MAREHPREFGEESRRVFALRLVGRPERVSGLASPCDMENEWPLTIGRHLEHHYGAIQRLDVPEEAVAKVRVPVLTIHGTWNRNAPYAAGREWALTLPDARLLAVEGAAHQVTADAPELVLPAMDEFASGRWPAAAERVTRMERSAAS